MPILIQAITFNTLAIMIRHLLFFCFLMCFSFVLPTQTIQAQNAPHSFQRQDIQQAVYKLQAELKANPLPSLHSSASKSSNDDSTAFGGITGRIDGITPGDSAWVLAIAAHLVEDPTAWALGEVQDDGTYAITGIKQGVYIVLAGAEGYLSQYFSRAYFIWEAHPIDVSGYEMTQGIDFFLEPTTVGSGSISGRVTVEETGEPLPGAIIQASLIGNPFVAVTGYSNEDGTFTLDRVRPGEYHVNASAELYFSEFYDNISVYEDREPTPVMVVDDEETRGIDFSLSRGGSVAGRVVDGDGNPLAGVQITVHPPNDDADPTEDNVRRYSWAITDENGEYLASGLVDGEYLVQAQYYAYNFGIVRWYDNVDTYEEATRVGVAVGDITSGIDFTIDVNKDLGSLSGQILNPEGDGVVEAQVRLESLSRAGYYYYAYAHPDRDGMYRFDNVPADSYRVALEYWTDWYYRIVWYDGVVNPENATPVIVEADRETTNINFTIPESNGTITGVVTDEAGNPVPNAYIQVGTSSFSHPYEDMNLWGYATTDAEGSYQIAHIPDGEYYISVFFCYFYECIQQWWPEGNNQDEARPVIVSDGQTEPPSVDFQVPIRQGSASISGRVLNEDGASLAGAQVSVMPYEYITPEGAPDVWTTQMHTFTDSTGYYEFSSLPAGTFILHSSYWGEGAYDEQWYLNAQDPQRATPVSIDNNQVVEDINFTLAIQPLYGSLAGAVMLEDGTSLRRAYVKVQPYYEEIPLDIAIWTDWYAVTDDDGRFVLDAIPAGEYMINVYAQGASDLYNDPDIGTGMVIITGGDYTEVELIMRRQERGTAELSGTVFGEQGDQPELAVLIATPATDGPGEPYYTAVTNESGAYAFDGLPDGDYFIQAIAPWYVSEYYDDTTSPEEAELVQVSTDRPVTGVDFGLDNLYYILAEPADADSRGASYSSSVWGQVINDRGEPVSMATVYVTDAEGDALLSAQTRNDGSYQISGIPPGESYHIKATGVGYNSSFNDGSAHIESTPSITMSSGAYQYDFTLSVNRATGTEENPSRPDQITISGNFPNPFTSQTSISLSLPASSHITIAIYDALGREVHRLIDGTLTAGSHTIPWDVAASTPALRSGIYFYRVSDGQTVKSGSMTFFK